MQPLTHDDIRVGEPLPCDACDRHGALLLRRGHVLYSARQIERLLARGLYRREGEAVRPAAPAAS